MSISTTSRDGAGEHLATYESMRQANLAVFDQAETRKKALEALAEVVGDYVTKPGADPEVRAAYIGVQEAGR